MRKQRLPLVQNPCGWEGHPKNIQSTSVYQQIHCVPSEPCLPPQVSMGLIIS